MESVEELHRREESKVFLQELICALGPGPESEEKPPQVVCSRAGDEIEELDVEDRGDAWGLKVAYQLHWPVCFSGRLDWYVPREFLLGLVAELIGCVGSKVREESMLWVWAERRPGNRR